MCAANNYTHAEKREESITHNKSTTVFLGYWSLSTNDGCVLRKWKPWSLASSKICCTYPLRTLLLASFHDRMHGQASLIGFSSADKPWSRPLATRKPRTDFWAGRDRTRHVHLLSAQGAAASCGGGGGSFFFSTSFFLHLFLLPSSALEVGDSLLGVGPRIKAKGANVQHKRRSNGPSNISEECRLRHGVGNDCS